MSAPRLRVGLLFGGASVEHEVSVVSARGVAGALDPKRFEIVPLAVTGDGRWLVPEAGARIVAGTEPRVEPGSPDNGASLTVDPGAGRLLRLAPGAPASPVPIDVVLSVMHGWGGEDGRVQGFLDIAGIPYVGPGVLGSAAGMDKQVAKAIFEKAGLPVGPWVPLVREDWRVDPAAAARAVEAALRYPVFVKPANGGSSVGISKVKRSEDLPAGLAAAFAHDRKVVVEQGMDVREVEVAVLGNARPEASVAGEIVPSNEFYDYAAKYLDGSSKLFIPAPLDAATSERIRALAVAAFVALDLAGLARVDFFVEKNGGAVWLNEVNTLPGFTPISMYPKLWEATGLPYGELLARLITLGLERGAEEKARVARRDSHGG